MFRIGASATSEASVLPVPCVVRPTGIKGRIEVDEIHRFIGDMFTQNIEVVAVVQLAHCAQLPTVSLSHSDGYDGNSSDPGDGGCHVALEVNLHSN